jgi:flagellin-like protein
LVKVRKDKNNIYTKLLKDKRGISPVITTVILVAVGIALAVAIGLWMSGLVATFTRFEKLEITSAYAISNGTGWNAYIIVNNTGSADATITTIMINGIPNTSWSSSAAAIVSTPPYSALPCSIPVGAGAKFEITLTKGQKIGSTTLTSGITLNIVLHSAAGKDYPASVTLP